MLKNYCKTHSILPQKTSFFRTQIMTVTIQTWRDECVSGLLVSQLVLCDLVGLLEFSQVVLEFPQLWQSCVQLLLYRACCANTSLKMPFNPEWDLHKPSLYIDITFRVGQSFPRVILCFLPQLQLLLQHLHISEKTEEVHTYFLG